MEIAGKVVIVTGGGNGIGKALCERCRMTAIDLFRVDNKVALVSHGL